MNRLKLNFERRETAVEYFEQKTFGRTYDNLYAESLKAKFYKIGSACDKKIYTLLISRISASNRAE
jgi:hypothetical protein